MKNYLIKTGSDNVVRFQFRNLLIRIAEDFLKNGFGILSQERGGMYRATERAAHEHLCRLLKGEEDHA